CEAEAEKLIASKVKKGYEEVGSAPAAGGGKKAKAASAKAAGKDAPKAAPKKAASKAVAAGARNHDLECAIVDSEKPNLDAWQVYADWLQSEGDVWGERLSLALQREKAKGAAKTKLTKQIAEYDETHAEALYGKQLAELIAKPDFAQVA